MKPCHAIGFALLLTSTVTAQTNLDALPDYQQDVISWVLPESSELPWSPEQVDEWIRDRGTRSASLLTSGQLLRGSKTDVENARRVILRLLSLQHDAPGEKHHGLWMTSVDSSSDRRDQNWREFVATGLIVSRDRFGDRLGTDLVAEIDRRLLLAAEGAVVRDVHPGYTNIALMSAFLMDYVGATQGDAQLKSAGLNKARAVYELFRVHNTFPEFNSPTYYGVNLMALAMWRSMARSNKIRDWGASMEQTLWEEIGELYHAGLRNMCGPYARAKGMNMTAGYTPILGLCIGMALDSEGHAPVPADRDGWQKYEVAYAPILSLMGLNVPKDVIPHLRDFQADHFVERQILTRMGPVNVRAILKQDWMMGAVEGVPVRHEQFHPATIHWRMDDSVGWLLVFGESGASGVIEEETMTLRVLRPDPDLKFRIQISEQSASIDALGEDRWALRGATIRVNSPLGTPQVQWVDDKRKGRVLEASWTIPDDWNADEAVVQLTMEEPK